MKHPTPFTRAEWRAELRRVRNYIKTGSADDAPLAYELVWLDEDDFATVALALRRCLAFLAGELTRCTAAARDVTDPSKRRVHARHIHRATWLARHLSTALDRLTAHHAGAES